MTNKVHSHPRDTTNFCYRKNFCLHLLASVALKLDYSMKFYENMNMIDANMELIASQIMNVFINFQHFSEKSHVKFVEND